MLSELLFKIRQLYKEAGESIEKARELRKLVEELPIEIEPLRLAYQAAGEALKARETWFPWEKLAHFQKSMEMFAKAIAQNKNQIEVRFLRYTIQKNTPFILGLSVDLQDDKQVILKHLQDSLTDAYMKTAIVKHLLENEHFNSPEKQFLQTFL
jgi:hypothetical protein